MELHLQSLHKGASLAIATCETLPGMSSTDTIDRSGAARATLSAMLLLAVAALLLSPSLAMGTLNSHSSPGNLTYAAQFADQFRAGVLYPRITPDCYDGLVGADFYLYPPLAFWIDAVLSVVTFDSFSVSFRLSLAALILLWASGLAMHAWLVSGGASPRIALLGALAYVAAPYHLLDHYWRGAFAEFAAFVVLPMLMLGVRRIADGRRFGVAWLALAYAALPMAHLPTSLLISVTALPMYVLWCAWRQPWRAQALRFLGRVACGGALGLGLASIYLIPALTLQGWIVADTLWSGSYRPRLWFLGTPARWPEGALDMMLIISCVSAAYGLAALAVLAAHRSAAGRQRAEPVFWALVTLVCLALVAGVVPWFWDLPHLAKVQFPWRLMVVVEFAALSALGLMDWRALARSTAAGRPTAWPLRIGAAAGLLGLAAFVALPALAIMLAGIELRIQDTHDRYPPPAAARQFQPAGYPQLPGSRESDLNLGPVANVSTIACTPAARLCHAENGPLGGLRLEIDADGPTEVVLRRFYWPFWRLTPTLPGPTPPIAPTETLRLVSFAAPAGHHAWSLEWAPVPEEKAGWVISGLSLVLLLGVLGRGLRRDGRPGVAKPSGQTMPLPVSSAVLGAD